MSPELKTVVVVGGSYVGLSATKALANVLPATHRILLIERHSHFNHLFAFPRFAVVPSHEHKAFIPYSAVFKGCPQPERHAVIQANVVSVEPNSLTIDREWQNSRTIPFQYLVVATGTSRLEPFAMSSDVKLEAISTLQSYQQQIRDNQSILIVGGGANGVQMATDIKEVYPDKDVILAHSRTQLMPEFHEDLDKMIKQRLSDLGVRLLLNTRVNLKQVKDDGIPKGLTDDCGKPVQPGLLIPAVGQVPNTDLLRSLKLGEGETLTNPKNGYLRVRPTLQLEAQQYPHIFALGDVADTGARKAARPAIAQAESVAKNIQSMINGDVPKETITVTPFGIHMTLGLKQNVIFRNPNPSEGILQPVVTNKDDGLEDLGVENVWKRRGIEVRDAQEYHL